MFAVAIMGLVLAIGAPTFSEFRRNNRLTGVANDFIATLQSARTEAIKRQRAVTLCPSTDPAADDAACSDGAFSGWIVFVDSNGNCTRDAGEDKLRTGGPIDDSLAAPSNVGCLPFGATGFLQAVAGAPRPAHVLFCDSRGIEPQAGTDQSAARGISINASGRAAVTRDIDTVTAWELSCP